jgi:23S rRNA pseudouridine1911/1915/1917 synthase
MQHPSSFVIPDDLAPDRADRVLSLCLPGSPSRSSLARLMRDGLVLVGDRAVHPSTTLNPGDRIRFLPKPRVDRDPESQEAPPVVVLHEDDDVIVVDKPAGLVVHPGAGRPGGTLMDMLIRPRPSMVGVGEADRWGIVHRLDRDTSGVMVVAKNAAAHAHLSRQFKEHSVTRRYVTLVRGNPGKDMGVVDQPIGRHAKDRKRISTRTPKPRRAVTHWKITQRFGLFTLLEIVPETGRTHQIRVHLAAAGLPVAGDPVYGHGSEKADASKPLVRTIRMVLKRQALHAAVLGFVHPGTGNYVEFASPLPADMEEAIRLARDETER